jgi:hypothetical protein
LSSRAGCRLAPVAKETPAEEAQADLLDRQPRHRGSDVLGRRIRRQDRLALPVASGFTPYVIATIGGLLGANDCRGSPGRPHNVAPDPSVSASRLAAKPQSLVGIASEIVDVETVTSRSADHRSTRGYKRGRSWALS